MKYNPNEIEQKWQKFWAENQTFAAQNPSSQPTAHSPQPKYYILDMFPYPSGAGLHVGHPLGYIASDIVARFKRHKGFNVLHPQGYDSFGLPAEQYAIQTGQHPDKTTRENIARYRSQLDRIGFSFDWSREVRTSDPNYYKWTQYIFIQLFNSWYNLDSDRAESICTLISRFEQSGTDGIHAACDDDVSTFTADQWNAFSDDQQQKILLKYRLTFLAETEVNWCPALGTVLANDEIVNGVSERGGHAVIRKKMTQWSMRISAYAERLLNGLETIDWTESLKESQRNWIGKSVGAMVTFDVIDNSELNVPTEVFYGLPETSTGVYSSVDTALLATPLEDAPNPTTISVFTTRPDTIFGVTFLTLAPEHEIVSKITTDEQKPAVDAYVQASARRSERDRMADVKTISGVFTGAFAEHPFTKEPIPIWIGDYVLAGYGTGAVMAVPCGDERDYAFANFFKGQKGMPEIRNIFADTDISKEAFSSKENVKIANSGFLDGMDYKEASAKAIHELEKMGKGYGRTNYRLRDAVFSRQRYWGEPFPVYYKDGLPQMIDPQFLPVRLPEVEKYLPTEDGQPPLGNSREWAWSVTEHKVVSNDRIDNETVFPLELNTMPGWAGSSWYWLRYMDAHNPTQMVSKEAEAYWQNVDLYIGGSEHATGHLLYSRFWNKFLKDRGFVHSEEPFKKLINQGMILGMSAFAYRLEGSNKFISKGKIGSQAVHGIHVDVSLVNASDELDIEKFKNHPLNKDFINAEFITEDNGKFVVGREVEKMSKSKYNVVTPDDICAEYGADTLRLYEMFLGPLEQAKPWNTAGITGVFGFLKKLWRLYFDENGLVVTSDPASKEALKSLHKTIRKVQDDIEGFSFNTSVSQFMICVNELTALKCHERSVLEPLAIVISPYAPHIAEELWSKLGHQGSISKVRFPEFRPEYLIESTKEYPVSFNGKTKFMIELPLELSKEEITEIILADERTIKQMDGRTPNKVIVVPGKIINLVG
ncbi:MAG: leucine--tRNA ligase [Flavobacterium sp.]|nr:MAG: leucine--tRNA ligase [Flavobacterium sp.]